MSRRSAHLRIAISTTWTALPPCHISPLMVCCIIPASAPPGINTVFSDDVLRARLKTVGVSEYSFHMEAGPESGTEWRIIDVGGSRSQVRTVSIFFLTVC